MLRLGDILEKVAGYRPGADLDLIKKAYVYSAKVHQGQVRKSGEPYLVHPLSVAGILADLRLDEASIVTGLLHDTVEDTLATLEELEELFGQEVADLVDGVTKLSQFSNTRSPTAEEKQAENFRKMIVAMAKDIRVILVKLADRTHNMRTLEHMKPEKQERIARETLEIYAPLANRLGIQWIKTELEDLSFRYLRPQEYQELGEKVAQRRKEIQKYIDEVIGIIERRLGGHGVPGEVTGRLKHLYSLYRKMRVQNIEFEQVHDLIAFRILTDSVPRCYEALGLVHALWKPVPGRFKDYVAIPKPNMYQSLHTTVIGPYGERVEIQIRTEEMHRVAEEGIAAHWAYKDGKDKADMRDAARFAWLRQLVEWQQDLKDPKEFLETVKVDLFSDEVFVFTPQGEVKSFPRGATPVDFAFAIHSEVGQRCVGAKVNGRIVQLRYKLKNGDTVEILTSPHAHPSKDWLTFVKTSRAQTRIRNHIRKQQRERSLAIGREILDKELRRYGRSLSKLLKAGDMKSAAEQLGYREADDLLSALGYGKVTTGQIVTRLLPQEETPEKKDALVQGRLSQIFKKVARTSSSGISIQGIEDVLVRFGRCCNPVPGDTIVGFITRGRGVTVHTSDCDKVLSTDPERRVDVTWDSQKGTVRPVSIRVITSDRRGLLSELSAAFNQAGVNISQANCRATGDERAVNTFEVAVADLKQLQGVIRQLERIRGVFSVERV